MEIYRQWYEQEKDSDAKMLAMLSSVPEAARVDGRFAQALTLAAHVSACRENWLDRMIGGAKNQTTWWPEGTTLESLGPRYAAMETRWTSYLGSLNDGDLDVDFDFPFAPDRGYRWNIEGQIMQMVGHGFYHRGQIALLVSQLGGEAVDTDYLYWATQQQPDRWKEIRFDAG